MKLVYGIIIGFFCGIILIGAIVESNKPKYINPPIELPEELECWVSDDKSKPDTVLIYEQNDTLKINYLTKPH